MLSGQSASSVASRAILHTPQFFARAVKPIVAPSSSTLRIAPQRRAHAVEPRRGSLAADRGLVLQHPALEVAAALSAVSCAAGRGPSSSRAPSAPERRTERPSGSRSEGPLRPVLFRSHVIGGPQVPLPLPLWRTSSGYKMTRWQRSSWEPSHCAALTLQSPRPPGTVTSGF
jgi:hypothetical protein